MLLWLPWVWFTLACRRPWMIWLRSPGDEGVWASASWQTFSEPHGPFQEGRPSPCTSLLRSAKYAWMLLLTWDTTDMTCCKNVPPQHIPKTVGRDVPERDRHLLKGLIRMPNMYRDPWQWTVITVYQYQSINVCLMIGLKLVGMFGLSMWNCHGQSKPDYVRRSVLKGVFYWLRW